MLDLETAYGLSIKKKKKKLAAETLLKLRIFSLIFFLFIFSIDIHKIYTEARYDF